MTDVSKTGANGGLSWEGIGDIGLGRPNLGPQAPVAVHRLLQFSLRHAIAEGLGCSGLPVSGESVCRFVVKPAGGADGG